MVHQVMIATVGVKIFPSPHSNTLAAGLDVKPAKLKPTAGFRLMHLFTTLPHTDQTLYMCVFVCVDPSLHHKHTWEPTLFINAASTLLYGSVANFAHCCGLLDAHSISFSLCPGSPPHTFFFYQCHPDLASTQTHTFKMNHHGHAMPCSKLHRRALIKTHDFKLSKLSKKQLGGGGEPKISNKI